ncbi:hypothetical protein [Lonsdalea iberica]|uniref:hypothetical protein n=1 Tax=Lonsdalea iberica TaxID=1082703 RepID=UPI001428D4D2|nr:hypothetical protein [Lonsdalea iberica]
MSNRSSFTPASAGVMTFSTSRILEMMTAAMTAATATTAVTAAPRGWEDASAQGCQQRQYTYQF